MIEFEIKAQATEDDIKRIEKLFKRRYEVVQVDTYFRHPSRDFASTDEALRVRVEDPDMGGTGVTYKGPRVDSISKTREEVEVGLKRDDVEKILTILERLGFKRLAVLKKLRRAYDAGNMLLYVDEVEGLGRFVEVESKASWSSDPSSEVSKLLSFLRGLGLTKLERRSYLELLLSRSDDRL